MGQSLESDTATSMGDQSPVVLALRGTRPIFARVAISPELPPPFLKPIGNGLLLCVRVQPRASRNEIGEALGAELKIKLTAPPVDSAANDALVKFLAGKLDCARNAIQLIRGHTSRHKVLRLEGLTLSEVMWRLSDS
jgi:uncharacterized protein (TIGR00251 family)